MNGFDLVHDIQDAQLLDRKRERIGRIDGLVLELEEGCPPRVATILVGGLVRGERIGGWAVALARLLRRAAGMKSDGVSRIPFGAVREISGAIQVDVDEETLDSEAVERWLSTHVIRRLPGGDRDAK